MTTNNTTRKTFNYAGVTYVLPFSANGYYVDDARRVTVCETNDRLVATALAKTLNELANKA